MISTSSLMAASYEAVVPISFRIQLAHRVCVCHLALPDVSSFLVLPFDSLKPIREPSLHNKLRWRSLHRHVTARKRSTCLVSDPGGNNGKVQWHSCVRMMSD